MRYEIEILTEQGFWLCIQKHHNQNAALLDLRESKIRSPENEYRLVTYIY